MYLKGTELVYFYKTGRLLKPVNIPQNNVSASPFSGVNAVSLLPGTGGSVLPGGTVDLPGASGF